MADEPEDPPVGTAQNAADVARKAELEALDRAEKAEAKSRFDYVSFSDAAKATNEDLTRFAKSIEEALERLPNSREKSLALTKLEESVMWARKALRDA